MDAVKKMPKHLALLVGLWIILLLHALIQKDWMTVCLNTLMLFGILKGNDLVRKLVIGLAGIGIVVGAFAVFAAGVAVFANEKMADSGGQALVTVALMVAASLLLLLVPVYTIYVLRLPRVQRWMFSRSTKIPLEEI